MLIFASKRHFDMKIITWHGFCLNVHIPCNGAGREPKGIGMDKKLVLQANNNLEVYMFNVGRGLAVLIKTPHNYAMLYDLGSSEELSPVADIYRNGSFFDNMRKLDAVERKIAQCIISHPHLDHISDLTDDNAEFINALSSLVSCQNDKNDNLHGHKIDFSRINNPNAEVQIKNYKGLYAQRQLPLRSFDPNVSSDFQLGLYYLKSLKASELFPKDNQEYSNSLSIVLYLSYHGRTILIPGDVTPKAFELILKGDCERRFTDCNSSMSNGLRNRWVTLTSTQPSLGDLLKEKGLTVLVAPHHGLESGYPQCLFDLLGDNKPSIILISEKPQSENSGSVDQRYQNGTCSKGVVIDGKTRYSLTTRNDGHIKVGFGCEGNGIVAKFSDFKDMF